jgi:hypothetical protein
VFVRELFLAIVAVVVVVVVVVVVGSREGALFLLKATDEQMCSPTRHHPHSFLHHFSLLAFFRGLLVARSLATQCLSSHSLFCIACFCFCGDCGGGG